MFFMILLGILAGVAVDLIFPNLLNWQYILIKFAVLPLIVGIGYEFIMFAGKHDNFVTRFFSAPGLWVQRLTTKEPTLDMLEVAICSTKCALRDEDEEFMEFYRTAMEKQKAVAVKNTEGGSDASDAISEQGEESADRTECEESRADACASSEADAATDTVADTDAEDRV
jgi:hypothetical protein